MRKVAKNDNIDFVTLDSEHQTQYVASQVIGSTRTCHFCPGHLFITVKSFIHILIMLYLSDNECSIFDNMRCRNFLFRAFSLIESMTYVVIICMRIKGA